MLYDNGLLARAYLHAGQLLDDPELVAVSVRTLDWALRDMRADDGGFHAALDADTDGIEGLTYVWTLEELRATLGEDADAAITWFGATPQGNFHDPHHPELTGRNVLEDRGARPDVEVARRIVATLAAARAERPQPGLDDKRLASWNFLMVAALADAGASLGPRGLRRGRPRHRRLRPGAHGRRGRRPPADLQRRRGPPARVPRGPGLRRRGARRPLRGDLRAAVAARGPRAGRRAARALPRPRARRLLLHGGRRRRRSSPGARSSRTPPSRPGSRPPRSACCACTRWTGEGRFADAAHGTLRLLGSLATTHPGAFGHLLQAHQLAVHPPRELAVVGPADGRDALLAPIRAAYRPDLVLAGGDGPDPQIGLLEGRDAIGGEATAYVCEGFVCQAPTTDAARLHDLLQGKEVRFDA